MEHVAQLQEGPNPAVLALNETAINKDDVVTADADNLFMAFSGAFSGTPAEGLTKTVLIKSSKHSQLVDAMMASFAGGQIANNFEAERNGISAGDSIDRQIQDRFPGWKTETGSAAPAEHEAGGKTGRSRAERIGAAEHRRPRRRCRHDPGPARGAGDSGDSGRRLIMPVNGNLSFAQSVVEQLAGDSNLIAVRSRASRERPFTVVQKMQADAESNYRTKIKELENSLAGHAAQGERAATEQRRRPAIHPFARAAAGAGQLPQERSRRENRS